MKVTRQSYWVAALGITALAFVVATAPAVGDAPVLDPSDAVSAWKAVAASGPVEALRPTADPAWTPLRRGDRLDPLSTVRTGRRGRATLTRSGDIVIVDPESLVELPDASLTADDSTVTQTTGSVIYEIDRRDGREFKVFTPYLVAGVKGTTFMVTVTDSYASVTVEDGLVEVTSNYTGESMNVGPGESILLDAAADAMIEHVTLNAKAGRDTTPPGKELRKLARADLRRLGHAVSQRHELLFDERELDELAESRRDPGLERTDPEGMRELEFEEELEDLDDLTEEELDPGLVDDQSRKTQSTQTPVQP